jgi:hypothetical protein
MVDHGSGSKILEGEVAIQCGEAASAAWFLERQSQASVGTKVPLLCLTALGQEAIAVTVNERLLFI